MVRTHKKSRSEKNKPVYHKHEPQKGVLFPQEGQHGRFSENSPLMRDRALHASRTPGGLRCRDKPGFLWNDRQYDLLLEVYFLGLPVVPSHYGAPSLIVFTRRSWHGAKTQLRELFYCNQTKHFTYEPGALCKSRVGAPIVYQDRYAIGLSLSNRGRERGGSVRSYMAKILRRAEEEVQCEYDRLSRLTRSSLGDQIEYWHSLIVAANNKLPPEERVRVNQLKALAEE